MDQQPKKKHADLASELGLAPSTLSMLVGQRMHNARRFGIHKEAKASYHVKLEVHLTRFKEVTAAGVNPDGKVLHEEAAELAFLLSIPNF